MSFRVFEPSYAFIDERLNLFLGERLSSVIAEVEGPLRLALVLYVVLYGIAILRGAISEPVMDFAVRSLKLLTQPVMEHCLAIPTDRLTLGARDRGLARIAFGDRLPPLIVERRDKGDLSRFYASVVRQSVDVVTELLIGGRLAAKGLVHTEDFDQALSDAQLIWDPATNRFLILGAIEVWARHWEARIERVRRAKMALEPAENA